MAHVMTSSLEASQSAEVRDPLESAVSLLR